MASRGFTWSKGFASMTKAGPRWTGKVALVPELLDEPLRWRKPQRVFVNSMSDLFHESLPDDAIAQVFATMALAERHTFQVLTKRPERMRTILGAPYQDHPPANFWPTVGALCEDHALNVERLSPGAMMGFDAWWQGVAAAGYLPNVWLGVSVEDQATADERIPLLLQTPAAVRFVSYEPALGPVNFRPRLGKWICKREHEHEGAPTCPGGLDWVIAGGESGPGARPFDVEWARSTVRQCRAAGVPVFVKQLGAFPVYQKEVGTAKGGSAVPLPLRDRKGGDPAEWPEDLRVREFPRSA
jgi:protein gp37